MRYLLFLSLILHCACATVSKSSDLQKARYIVILNTQVVFGGEIARCVSDSLELQAGSVINRFAIDDIVLIERPANQMGYWVFGGIGIPLGALLGGVTGLAIVSGDSESNPKAFVYSIVTGAIAGAFVGISLWEQLDSDRLAVSAFPASERKSRINSFIK